MSELELYSMIAQLADGLETMVTPESSEAKNYAMNCDAEGSEVLILLLLCAEDKVQCRL